MSIKHIPTQSIPAHEKDSEWKRATVEAYIQNANFQLGANSYRQWLLKLYDYYNGKIDEADYTYVIEPYGKKRENFPAKIRNFNILKPTIDLLLGEKAKRPFNWNVVVSGSDITTVKEHAKNEKIKENIYQHMINMLNDEGVETGMENEEVQLPEEVEEIFERNWKDQRAIMGQHALNYLIKYLYWYDKVQRGFKDFLVSGYVFTHRTVRNNDPEFMVLNPLDVDYDKDPNVELVEDGNWAVIRELVSRSSVIDVFRKKLDKKIIDRLENPHNTNRDIFFWYNQDEQIFHDDWDEYTELVTVYWKSIKKIAFVTSVDEFGDEYERIEDEYYEFNPETDLDIEYDYVNEVWQGYRIDGDIYLDIRPFDHQRSSIDNPSKTKLPVNGRAYAERNSSNISLIELGIPFQLNYNVFKYRLENAISRSKDILAMMDINMIPEGWTMDKFMYFVESTGIAWVNYQKEGIQFNPQHQGVLDLSIKTINQYIDLLRFTKEEWEYLSGITRQRMGEMSPYEGKGTSQQSIIQSSHITEDYFRKFSIVEEKDLQAMLDLSQLAWIDGKKGSYILEDGSEQYMEIDGDLFAHAELGVFVKDASIEAEKIEYMRAMAQHLAQGGAPVSVIAEIIDSENFAQIKSKVKKAEAHMQQLEENQQKMQQELQEQEMQLRTEELDREDRNKELDRQNKIQVELLKKEELEDFEDLWKQELERRKIEHTERIENRKLSEEERSNRAQEKLKEKEIAVKKQKPASK